MTVWQELHAPYEIGRSRELIGRAYRLLGDEEGAQLEFDAAQEVFDRLGAIPDSERLASESAHRAAAVSGALTGREVEVLRLVAEDLSDAEVAERLFLSPRTVSQHLRSVYNKLGVNSRGAAIRFAVEQRLV